MGDENNHNDPNNDPESNRISLDLSLGIGPQEQDPQEDDPQAQVPQEEDPQEQDPVEERSEFMQLLRSAGDPPPYLLSSLLPPHLMARYGYYNHNVDINSWNAPVAGLFSSPLLGEAIPMHHSSYPPQGQLFHQPPPPQAIQGGSEALETPRPGPRLGRPPINGHQARRNSPRAVAAENNVAEEEIVLEPPYEWATTRPAVIHSLRYLLSNNITVIDGVVHCRPCDRTQTLRYSLTEKFEELYRYIKDNKEGLRQRAPDVWMNSKLPPCDSCESGMKPVISERKEDINWLFLLLGQMLGCCTLEQLRYFCDMTSQHRTGAKDRVLYLTYLGLCKQLKPCCINSQL